MNTVLDYDHMRQVLNSGIGNQYKKTVDQSTSGSLTQAYTVNIQQRLKTLYLEYPELTSFQTDFLGKLFQAFSSIEEQIDPAKINFKDALTEDSELLLWYRSKEWLVNLIIHEEELVGLSCVSKTHPSELTHYDVEQTFADYEGLAYAFLSKV